MGKSGKRKLLDDPIAAAALNALDSSDEDEPVKLKQKKRNKKSSKAKKRSGKTRGLKPLFEKGDEVYSIFWPTEEDRLDHVNCSWHPGVITSYEEVETDGPYGPTRTYDVHFDDGDELDDVEEHFVFPKTDYALMMKYNFKTDRWIGVRNPTDKDSPDDWARVVGWYVANIDGKEKPFTFLADAMDEYDNSVVQRKKRETKRSELNRPEQWAWLFDDSDSDDSESPKKGRKEPSKPRGRQRGRPRGKRKQLKTPPPRPAGVPDKGGSSEPEKKRQKVAASCYKNVSYSKQDRKYLAQIFDVEGKKQCLGYYRYEADAALAADKGSMLGASRENNFATRKEYEDAIQKEVTDAGQSVDLDESYNAVVQKAEVYVSKIYALRNAVNTDGYQEGTSSRLSTPRGRSPATAPSMRKSPSDPHSSYEDITYCTNTRKFKAHIQLLDKKIYLGRYNLETDAAMAHDKAVRVLNLPLSFNFKTLEIYKQAKKRELERTAFGERDSMSAARVEKKVEKMIAKGKATSDDEDSDSDVETNAASSDGPMRKSPGAITTPRGRPKKHSSLVGVCYVAKTNKFSSHIYHEKKLIYIGNYLLEADGAFARDEAVRMLRTQKKMNFETVQKYEEEKLGELGRRGLGTENAMSAAAISSKVSEMLSKHLPSSAIDPSAKRSGERVTPTRQTEHRPRGQVTSSFKGVSFYKPMSSYVANIQHAGKAHSLGYYKLETDAAFAYNEAAKLLRGADCGQLHFASRQAYFEARSKEVKERSSASQSIQDTEKKVRNYLTRIPCPELSVLNDEMANKWASNLSPETGKEFLDSYQTNINEVLGLTETIGGASSEPSVVSMDIGGKAEDTDLKAFFKPIAEENSDDDSASHSVGKNDASSGKAALQSKITRPEQNDESDSDASLFSDADDARDITDKNAKASCDLVKQNDNLADVDVNLKAKPPPPATNKEKESAPINEFPSGCLVMWDFDGKSFNTGVVKTGNCGTSEDAVCEVIAATKSKGENQTSRSIPAKELKFGPDCPVHVSAADGDDACLLEGRILFCKASSRSIASPSYEYTIFVPKDGNRFQLLQGVAPERVKYRKVPSSTAQKSGSGASSDDGPPAELGMSAPEPEAYTPRKRGSGENDSQASSQQFFSSNSTITTVDSPPDPAQSPSRRDVVDCRVYFPKWMVRDDRWKKSLFSYLRRVDLNEKIGKRRKCSLTIIEEGDPHVLIETKRGNYATEDIRKSKEYLETCMLHYIGHDGSCGRMFYDLARRCQFLHPPRSAGSTSVMQRNPFSPDREMCFVNIVDLPLGKTTEGKYPKQQSAYHGWFLLAKGAGVLGRIKNETKCEIKVCGDDFSVRTKYCKPYVWVMGDQPARVDRAVDILQKAIEAHMKRCNCIYDALPAKTD